MHPEEVGEPISTRKSGDYLSKLKLHCLPLGRETPPKNRFRTNFCGYWVRLPSWACSLRPMKHDFPTCPHSTFFHPPTAFESSSGLIAAGGQKSEIYLAPINAIPPSHSSLRLGRQHRNDHLHEPLSSLSSSQGASSFMEPWSGKLSTKGQVITNSLFFTNLAISSSPYHLPMPSDSNPIGALPRLFVSHNDAHMRVYNVSTAPVQQQQGQKRRSAGSSRLEVAGSVLLETRVNHGACSLFYNTKPKSSSSHLVLSVSRSFNITRRSHVANGRRYILSLSPLPFVVLFFIGPFVNPL